MRVENPRTFMQGFDSGQSFRHIGSQPLRLIALRLLLVKQKFICEMQMHQAGNDLRFHFLSPQT